MQDKNNLKFIQGFSKIKISKACKFFGYNQSNLMKGKSGREKEKNVRKFIEYELANLRLEEVGELVGEIECQEKSSTIQ
jgi:hypothetical protein